MTIRRVVSWAGLVAPAVAASVAGAQVSTLNPSAKVTVTIDGNEPMALVIPGLLLPDGRFKFTQEIVDGSGMVILVNHTVDSVSNPQVSFTGQVKYTNTSTTEHSVNTKLVFQACPVIPGGTLFGGAVSFLVQTNADGGGVTCAPGSLAAWQALINEEVSHNLFFCPFQMTKTGSGSLQTSTNFGTPVPSKVGPDLAESIGMHHNISVTGGEAVTLTSAMVVKSLGSPSTCPGDLDYDGLVNGADIGLILANWGEVGWCVEGDLDHDGVIGGGDIGSLLGMWGPCGG